MSLETDAFDHQHAVAQQALNSLLLELLQKVGAVAREGVHGHSASSLPGVRLSISKLDRCTHKEHCTLAIEIPLIKPAMPPRPTK